MKISCGSAGTTKQLLGNDDEALDDDDDEGLDDEDDDVNGLASGSEEGASEGDVGSEAADELEAAAASGLLGSSDSAQEDDSNASGYFQKLARLHASPSLRKNIESRRM